MQAMNFISIPRKSSTSDKVFAEVILHQKKIVPASSREFEAGRPNHRQ